MRTPLLDLVRPGFHGLCRAYFGLELTGVGNIPASGPLIVTPNHQTYADPALVTIPVRRRVYYMAWNQLFEIPVFSWMIRRLRAFPVRIDSADPSSLPVTIAGGHEAWPPGRVLPRRGRISITYHPPLEPDPALEPRQAATALAQRARAVIAASLGETATAPGA